MRVIAAIPNFNGGKNLTRLLPQLLEEDFDAIYVADDASTDESLQLLYEFSESVQVIEGEKNLGPGGNRNRIIPLLQAGDIVVFFDADTLLKTRNVRQIVVGLFENNPTAGLIGGGILNKKGRPMGSNYGINTSLVGDAIGWFLSVLADILHFRPLIWPIRGLARRFTLNVEIAHYPPQERIVDWVAEGHFYIHGDRFKKMGGYDESLQYHEGKDLARRIRQEGDTVLFNPSVWVQHLELDVRSVSKTKEAFKTRRIEKDDQPKEE